MAWSESQRYRLAIEKKILEEHLPGFSFFNPTDNTYVSGRFESNSKKSYEVRIVIPSGFPDECPKAYITHPNPLWGYNQSKTIKSYETSHEMHTLTSHPNGWVQVCHFKQSRWNASHTIVKVLIKVRIWIEAYEGHLSTGKFINHYVKDME